MPEQKKSKPPAATNVQSEKAPLRRSIPPQPQSLVSKEQQKAAREAPEDGRSAVLRREGYEQNEILQGAPPLDEDDAPKSSTESEKESSSKSSK